MSVSMLDKIVFYFLLLYALASSISIAVANIGISIALLFAIIRYVKEPFKPRIDKGVAAVILLFWFTVLLSAIFAHKESFVKLWAYAYRALPIFLAAFFIKSQRHLMITVMTMACSIFIADSYAIWQGLHGANRASAFGSVAMILAGYHIQMIPIMLVIALEDNNFSRLNRGILGVIVIASLLAALYNGTRGAWLSLFIVFVVYGLIKARTNMKLAACIALLVIVTVIGIMAFPGGQERVASVIDLTNQSNVDRLFVWQGAWQMFLDHPVIGSGYFEEIYLTRYISPLAEKKLGHAHSNYLQILAENGIIGFLGFCIMFLYILHYLYKNYVNNNNHIALGVLLATLALLLQGLTEFNFGNSAVIRMYWFILSLTMVMGTTDEQLCRQEIRKSFVCTKKFLS